MLLYDCMPSLSQFLSINKLLKNDFSKLGMGGNPTTPLYSDTRKPQAFMTKKRYEL